MADRKPIRWAVPRGAEGYMGLAQYFLTHEENMRQSFSQPSRRARRTLPDGTCIDYIMNDVVDCIMISRPQIQARGLGKEMVWDKLPPFLTGTTNIDLSSMTADPDVSGGYYCTVSVINGTDENGRTLSAEFSVKTEDSGWSIERIDGRSARLKLGADVEGECDIVARDGKTELRKKVNIAEISDVPVVFTGDNWSIWKDEVLWKEGYSIGSGGVYTTSSYRFRHGGGTTSKWSIIYTWEYANVNLYSMPPLIEQDRNSWYNYNGDDVWSPPNSPDEFINIYDSYTSSDGDNLTGVIYTLEGETERAYSILNGTVTLI